MGKKVAIFVLALLLLSLGLALPPKAHSLSQTQYVKVVNWSWYIDPEGYLDVVGLVQNTGPNTISSIMLAGSVIGPDNGDMADAPAQVWVLDLLPNQEAPFYIEFMQPHISTASSWYDVVQGGALSSISIRALSANATSDYQYQGLKIQNDKGSIGTTGGFNGAYVVNGEITNTGNQTATSLTVVAAFFNSTGTVVGVGYTNYLDPRSLVAGNHTTFQVAALDLNQSLVGSALQIKTYRLLAQCQGPILQGAAPIVSPAATGSTGPTDTASSKPNGNFNFSSIFPIVVGVVIAVIVIAAAVVVVRQVLRRSTRPPTTVKEARKAKKQG